MQNIRRFYGHFSRFEDGEDDLWAESLNVSLSPVLGNYGFNLRSTYTTDGYRSPDIIPKTINDGVRVSREICRWSRDKLISNSYTLDLTRGANFERFVSLIISGNLSEEFLGALSQMDLVEDSTFQRGERELSRHLTEGLKINNLIWRNADFFPIPVLRERR